MAGKYSPTKSAYLPVILAAGWLVCSASTLFGTDDQEKQRRHFEEKIAPILQKNCSRCHSHDAGKSENGLMLDSRKSMLKGGESGPAIVPGKPDQSLLIQAVRYEELEMPPDGKLQEGEIQLLEAWVRNGAISPDRRFAGMKSTAVTADDLWSFQSVRNPVPPPAEGTWHRTEVDRFILSRLSSKRLSVVEDANPSDLSRRIYLDLIGLPPTPEQQFRFLTAYSSDPEGAIATAVDDLLKTSHFGERWGRHWLDTARYAESNGNNRNRVLRYAWRYRNWVIDSLNSDQPYDEFLKEQIAGDLMATDSIEKKKQQRIATGFLAIGPKPYYPTIVPFDPEEPDRARFEWAAEQIDATTKGMLGLTVGCARCHDHKFDPIPTRDYYALMGIFRSTNPRFGMYWDLFGVDEGQAQRDFLYDFNLLVLNDEILEKIKPLQAKYRPLVIEQNQIDLRRRHWPQQVERMQLKIQQDKGLGENQIALMQTNIESRLEQLKRDEKRLPVVKKLKQQLRDEFTFQVDQAVGVEDGEKISDVHVRIAGEHHRRGQLVPRGFLSTMKFEGAPNGINREQSGRLELSEWIAHPNNPLTARVAVNRVWYHLFGRGIVESLDNFGSAGSRPSHPELLDHLASKFVHEFAWSRKKLIRYVMSSRVYRLSSSEKNGSEKCKSVDPAATLYWRTRPRRLEAEAIRDSMLSVAGRLMSDRPKGSPVVDFEYYADIRHEDRIRANQLLASNLRTIYVPTLRGHRHQLYELFNYPDDEAVNSERSSGSVPTQALYLLNNPVVMGYAESLEQRLGKDAGDDPLKRLDRLYWLCFGRAPTTIEIAADRSFLQKQEASAGERQAWVRLAHSMLISGEFLYRF